MVYLRQRYGLGHSILGPDYGRVFVAIGDNLQNPDESHNARQIAEQVITGLYLLHGFPAIFPKPGDVRTGGLELFPRFGREKIEPIGALLHSFVRLYQENVPPLLNTGPLRHRGIPFIPITRVNNTRQGFTDGPIKPSNPVVTWPKCSGCDGWTWIGKTE
jgi:hypothetical protein